MLRAQSTLTDETPAPVLAYETPPPRWTHRPIAFDHVALAFGWMLTLWGMLSGVGRLVGYEDPIPAVTLLTVAMLCSMAALVNGLRAERGGTIVAACASAALQLCAGAAVMMM